MFAFGPMKMTPLGYYSEIGVVYLTFPVFSILAVRLAKPWRFLEERDSWPQPKHDAHYLARICSMASVRSRPP